MAAVLSFAASRAHAQSIPAATTNGSISITTGNTFQQVLGALGAPPAARRSLTIENNNSTDSCWLFIGGGSATKADTLYVDFQ